MYYRAATDEKAIAIVLTCLDHRLPSTFWDFLTNDCGLRKGQFYLMKVAGGPAPFAHPKELGNRLSVVMEDFSLICANCASIEKIILINHQGCLFYKHHVPNPDYDTQIEKSDLKEAKQNPVLRCFNKKIEIYHATKINGNGEVDFEKL